MIEPGPEQDTPRGNQPASLTSRRLRRALPWLAAAGVLIVLAGAAGVGTAYLIAALRAAPSPDAAFMPTPTPTASPSADPSPTASSEPTEEPTAEPTVEPTVGPTEEPTAEPSPLVYTVVAGDTIARIASRFGVSAESIIALNNLRNPNRILPGQELLIPVGSASPTP